MSAEPSDPLPPEADLALAWSSPKVRGPLSMALQLDRRLARIVARTQEPMLGQMRLAWWRDALGKPPGDRPRGDVVLDGLGLHWSGTEAALVTMIDGWEVLVTADQIGPDEARAFATQRGAFFGALFGALGEGGDDAALARRLAAAGQRWAAADAAAAVGDPAERAALIAAGCAQERPTASLPRAFRGLAVLDALAQRALRRGGRPLMEGRGASLTAIRAAIFRN